MTSPLLIAGAALVVLLIGAAQLVGAGRALRNRRLVAGAFKGSIAVALLALAALAVTVVVATRGYRALTEEELAATVRTEPLPHQHFRATIILPEGRVAMYDLAGDAFYVDAHIVKWHTFLNLLGLHTAYELDRVGGRYDDVADESRKPHTMYSLSRSKPFDMVDVVRAVPLLDLIVDARYGSATFTATRRPAAFVVHVSTTGLLVRPVPR